MSSLFAAGAEGGADSAFEAGAADGFPFVGALDGDAEAGAAEAGFSAEAGMPDPLPATSSNLSMSSCEELISRFTWGCSKSGTFTVPLMSAAVARSATNCASSFPPDRVNLPVRNAIGSFQPLRASVTLDRLDSACQSCMRMGLMAKLCSVMLRPLVSASGSALPLITLPTTISAPVRLMLSIWSSVMLEDSPDFGDACSEAVNV